jgi:hypothetical protein
MIASLALATGYSVPATTSNSMVDAATGWLP